VLAAAAAMNPVAAVGAAGKRFNMNRRFRMSGKIQDKVGFFISTPIFSVSSPGRRKAHISARDHGFTHETLAFAGLSG
jgi:hypothetical protein